MFIELLRNRRSVRQFKTESVSRKELTLLQEALLRSPSSRCLNPWEFVLIRDKNRLDRLSESKQHGSAFLKNAPLAVIVLGDRTKTDVWVEDCSIASIIVQLAAEDLGLGSCWVQIRNRMHNDTQTSEAYVRNLLHIPDCMAVESIIAIGRPKEKNRGHDRSVLQYEKIHEESYTN